MSLQELIERLEMTVTKDDLNDMASESFYNGKLGLLCQLQTARQLERLADALERMEDESKTR